MAPWTLGKDARRRLWALVSYGLRSVILGASSLVVMMVGSSVERGSYGSGGVYGPTKKLLGNVLHSKPWRLEVQGVEQTIMKVNWKSCEVGYGMGSNGDGLGCNLGRHGMTIMGEWHMAEAEMRGVTWVAETTSNCPAVDCYCTGCGKCNLIFTPSFDRAQYTLCRYREPTLVDRSV